MNEIAVFIDHGEDHDPELHQLRDWIAQSESGLLRGYRFKAPSQHRARAVTPQSHYFKLLAIYGFLRICLRSEATKVLLLRCPAHSELATSLRKYLFAPGECMARSGFSPELQELAAMTKGLVLVVTPETRRDAIRRVRALLATARGKDGLAINRAAPSRTIVVPISPSKLHLPPRLELPRPPKLAVLFLARQGLPHHRLWQAWARNSEISFLSHIKHPKMADEFSASVMIPRTVETKWGCISIVRAMLTLLEHAVQSTNCSHFVFASESCIPVARLSDILMAINLDSRSRIGFDDMAALAMKNSNKARRGIYLDGFDPSIFSIHSQWVLLSRADACALLEEDLTQSFRHVFAPDESYIGTLLHGMGKSRQGVHRHRITWDHWQSPTHPHPTCFNSLTPATLASMLASGSFFARKFSPGVETGLLQRIWGN